MAKLVRVYEPGEDRQIHFRLREHQAPGLMRFLAALPFGVEGAFWRGVAQLWVEQHAGSAGVDEQLRLVLEAGGADRAAPVAVRKPRGRAAQSRPTRTSEMLARSPALVVPPPTPITTSQISMQQQGSAAPQQLSSSQAQPTAAPPDLVDAESMKLLDEFDGFAG